MGSCCGKSRDGNHSTGEMTVRDSALRHLITKLIVDGHLPPDILIDPKKPFKVLAPTCTKEELKRILAAKGLPTSAVPDRKEVLVKKIYEHFGKDIEVVVGNLPEAGKELMFKNETDVPVSVEVEWGEVRKVQSAGGSLSLLKDGCGLGGQVEFVTGKDIKPASFEVHQGVPHIEAMGTSMGQVTIRHTYYPICQNKIMGKGDIMTIKRLSIVYTGMSP